MYLSASSVLSLSLLQSSTWPVPWGRDPAFIAVFLAKHMGPEDSKCSKYLNKYPQSQVKKQVKITVEVIHAKPY